MTREIYNVKYTNEEISMVLNEFFTNFNECKEKHYLIYKYLAQIESKSDERYLSDSQKVLLSINVKIIKYLSRNINIKL